jgi:hypothetical protein
MSNIKIELVDDRLDHVSDAFFIESSSKINIFPASYVTVGEHSTIAPIPLYVLEDYLRDMISNWNQKQKK